MSATTQQHPTPLAERDVRALTECMSVLDDVGRARDAPGLFLVVTGGESYLVDAETGACECDDSFYRTPDGGCKHARRVAFATGERAIPAWADPSAVDPLLGAFLGGEA